MLGLDFFEEQTHGDKIGRACAVISHMGRGKEGGGGGVINASPSVRYPYPLLHLQFSIYKNVSPNRLPPTR